MNHRARSPASRAGDAELFGGDAFQFLRFENSEILNALSPRVNYHAGSRPESPFSRAGDSDWNDLALVPLSPRGNRHAGLGAKE